MDVETLFKAKVERFPKLNLYVLATGDVYLGRCLIDDFWGTQDRGIEIDDIDVGKIYASDEEGLVRREITNKKFLAEIADQVWENLGRVAMENAPDRGI